jgi:hypothetical protein
VTARSAYLAIPPNRSPLKKHKQRLLAMVRQEPDLTLQEVQARLFDERQQKAGLGRFGGFMTATGSAHKKSLLVAILRLFFFLGRLRLDALKSLHYECC